MRVLHVVAGNLFGGIEAIVIAFAGQRREGFEQEVAVFFEHGRLAEDLRAIGTEVHVLGPVRIRYPWTVLRARRRLRLLLAQRRIDAVIIHSAWLHGIAAPAVRDHGALLVHAANDFQQGRNLLEKWASWTKPDLVLTLSNAIRDSVHTVFPDTPAIVLRPPVAPPTASTVSRDEVRSRCQTDRDAIVVVMASRLEPWKGHRLLLDAVTALDRRFTVWIAGGAQRPSEQAYLDELVAGAPPCVRFLGQRRDVRDLLRAADIHCQPNTGPEPFGVAFVEALYAGLPIVTTRMGGALEIVDDTCGILVAPEPASVVAALERLGGAEERRRLGASGPARARSLCDPSRSSRRP